MRAILHPSKIEEPMWDNTFPSLNSLCFFFISLSMALIMDVGTHLLPELTWCASQTKNGKKISPVNTPAFPLDSVLIEIITFGRF